MWPHRALTAEQLEAAPECLLSVACHSWWIPESITRYGVTAKFCDTIRAAFVPVGEKYLGQIFPRYLHCRCWFGVCRRWWGIVL